MQKYDEFNIVLVYKQGENKMNILITAGGTSERIDEVRTITNKATGRLGSMIADNFLDNQDVSVTYVCPKDAIIPQNSRAEILYIDNVQSLQFIIEKLLKERNFEGVVHSMAVSDYAVKYSVPSDTISNFIAENLQLNSSNINNIDAISAQIHSALMLYHDNDNSKKISSDIEHLFLCLEKTPKIIRLFKQLQPNTVLVGFKLLVDVEEEQLFRAAKKQMDENKCDFVLANDQKNIDDKTHIGFLIGADNKSIHLNTKSEIARAITDSVVKKVKENKGK